MTYAASNPPRQLVQGLSGSPSLWIYNSTDVHTDVDATDYFTNGDDLGLKVGDCIIVQKTSATIGSTLHYVTTVTAGGAATVAAAILS